MRLRTANTRRRRALAGLEFDVWDRRMDRALLTVVEAIQVVVDHIQACYAAGEAVAPEVLAIRDRGLEVIEGLGEIEARTFTAIERRAYASIGDWEAA